MRTHLAAALAALLTLSARADDWPQFQGPGRDNVSKETGLLKNWPANGPALAWTNTSAGVGYSSPAVVGDRIFLLGARGDDEFLIALDTSGKEVWKARVGPTFDFKSNQWGKGPRSTPSVAGGLVYALGGFGDLVCVEATTGREVWSKRMQKDLQGEVNPIALNDEEKLGWGYSWSPLVDGDQLVCYPGGPKGAVAALDLKTGAVRWRSTDLKEQATYASPIVAEIGGVRQYVVLHQGGLAGVAAKNGQLLWTWAKKPAYGDVVIPTPIYHNGHVYISAGYTQATCDLVKISADGGKFKAEKVYTARSTGRVMKNTVGGSVLVDGHVYGHSNKVGWVCQDLKTGKEVWAEKGKFGAGSLVYADGHLYCHGEDDCALALVEASPKGWTEKGRFPLPRQSNQKGPSGRNWTPPVIANGHLFVRDQEYLFCYKIK